MGMLDRIKRNQFAGFKDFVQNMEITGIQSRTHIFVTGVLEDPIFMAWVMKNIKTFDDFMNLTSDDIDSVLKHQDQVMSVFAKCMFGEPEEKLRSLESVIPRLMSKFKDELSYIKAVTPAEKEGAKYFMVKTTRKLQAEEVIQGFPWQLPPYEIFFPKTLKDGKQQIVFDNQVVAAEGNIEKGKRTGTWLHYYDSGKKLAEGEYYDGLKIGEWTFFYGNGSLKAQGKYRDDLKHGSWKEWDRAGHLLEVEYNEGIRVNAQSSSN